ncbi:DUF429 domain-containing protein [Chloroflexota bacterium]
MIIIGVDHATEPSKTGLALGRFKDSQMTVIDVIVASSSELPEVIINEWLQNENPALLALDAPLGWPATLARGLASHNAGELLPGDSNDLFRRETDRVVKAEIHKQPLDVGADRIARTAHSALSLLNTLREATGSNIPLAWHIDEITEPCAIEVYPAATLKVRDIPTQSYKEKKDFTRRINILNKLSEYLTIGTTCKDMCVSNADALDAVVCLLAASDFLQDKCIQPHDMDLARKEGWIWVCHQEKK